MKQEQKPLVSKKVFFLVFVMLVIVTACASTDPRGNDTPVLLPEAIEITKNGIKIAVYPQLELLAIIQFLGGHREIINEYIPGFLPDFEIEYEQIIKEYFADFKEHEAILFANRYLMEGFSFNRPPAAALMINRDFTFDQVAFATAPRDLQPFYSIIDEFVSVMKSFYIESDFETFFLGKTDFYTAILEQTAGEFPNWDMISVMESFYGKKQESYNVVLSPLYGNIGYGAIIARESGLAIYSIVGPMGVNENGFPDFGGTVNFAHITLHEFGHTFLNFLFSDNMYIQRALEDSEYLMEPIKEIMERQAYNLWGIACEELILRAIVIRMLADNTEIDVARELRREHDRGFIYIHTVYDLLQKYIDNRERYPVFDDFVPVLIGELMRIYPERYGDSLRAPDLTLFALEINPIRVDIIYVNDFDYEASYFGTTLISLGDFVSLSFWRLENAYNDFRGKPANGDWLPFDNYPMGIEINQVFVVDAARTDGSILRLFYRSDEENLQGRPVTTGFNVD